MNTRVQKSSTRVGKSQWTNYNFVNEGAASGTSTGTGSNSNVKQFEHVHFNSIREPSTHVFASTSAASKRETLPSIALLHSQLPPLPTVSSVQVPTQWMNIQQNHNVRHPSLPSIHFKNPTIEIWSSAPSSSPVKPFIPDTHHYHHQHASTNSNNYSNNNGHHRGVDGIKIQSNLQHRPSMKLITSDMVGDNMFAVFKLHEPGSSDAQPFSDTVSPKSPQRYEQQHYTTDEEDYEYEEDQQQCNENDSAQQQDRMRINHIVNKQM